MDDIDVILTQTDGGSFYFFLFLSRWKECLEVMKKYTRTPDMGFSRDAANFVLRSIKRRKEAQRTARKANERKLRTYEASLN